MNMKYLKNIGNQEFNKGREYIPPNSIPKEQKLPESKPKLINLGINRWTVFGVIAAFALVTVLSVTSVIQVNTLLKENEDLQKEYKALRQRNEFLKRQVNQLESPERITTIAKEKLGMQVANTAPQFVNQ